MRMMLFGLLLYSFEHRLNRSKSNVSIQLRRFLDHYRIEIEKFTYSKTGMRDQWLDLLEEIHFLGVSVRRSSRRFRPDM